MGKTNDMATTIQELRAIAATVNDIANWLSDIYINLQADADEKEQSRKAENHEYIAH